MQRGMPHCVASTVAKCKKANCAAMPVNAKCIWTAGPQGAAGATGGTATDTRSCARCTVALTAVTWLVLGYVTCHFSVKKRQAGVRCQYHNTGTCCKCAPGVSTSTHLQPYESTSETSTACFARGLKHDHWHPLLNPRPLLHQLMQQS
jgi:hypothetical protein